MYENIWFFTKSLVTKLYYKKVEAKNCLYFVEQILVYLLIIAFLLCCILNTIQTILYSISVIAKRYSVQNLKGLNLHILQVNTN